MRRTRKLARMRAAAAVAAVALLVAAGCGSDDSSSSTTSSSSGRPQSGTVTVWHNFNLDSQMELLRRQADLFEEANPGSDVKYVYVPYHQFKQKLIAAAPTQTGPDVILHEGSGAVQLRDANTIADMTRCVASWDTASDISAFAPRKIGDATYGVLPYGNLVALWYNRTLLDRYGLEPPRTVDELEAAMEKVKAGGGTGITLAGNPTFEGSWSVFPFFTAEGVTFPDVDKPATPEVFAQLADWADKGWIPRSVTTFDQPTAMQRFLVGDVAFAVNGNWEADHARRAAKFDYGVVTMPAGTEPSRVYISGETAMIGSFSKNPDLACAYLGDSWFSRAGQKASIELNKSVPTIDSLADDPALTEDPVLSVFAEQASTADNVPGGQIAVANGTAWSEAVSAAFAGSKDPQELADEAIAETDRIVGDDTGS